jgi:hypothetical protein
MSIGLFVDHKNPFPQFLKEFKNQIAGICIMPADGYCQDLHQYRNAIVVTVSFLTSLSIVLGLMIFAFTFIANHVHIKLQRESQIRFQTEIELSNQGD